MRSIVEFLMEGVSSSMITNLYVQPTCLGFRYNGVSENIGLFELPDKFFPFTKKNFKFAMTEVEKLIIELVGEDVREATNWAEAMAEVTDQLERFYIKTNRNITEVSVDEFDVILAYEGDIVSFNLMQYGDDPFPSEEAAIAFVEEQLKPFKSARNYKKVLDLIILIMDDQHYWESED